MYKRQALICLVAALPRIHTLALNSGREWSILFALAAIPTVCGHSLLNASMRRIRGQVVSLCNVSQFVFAGLMGYLLFGEVPHGVFYVASAVIVIGVAIVVLAAPAEAADRA